MNDNMSDHSPILTGWKEIAKYLNMGIRTVQRYECEHQLPIRRAGGPKGSVIATKQELDDWLTQRPKRQISTAQKPFSQSLDWRWAALQDSMEKMGELRKELNQRRAELRAAVSTLHSSIRVVDTPVPGVPAAVHVSVVTQDAAKSFNLLEGTEQKPS